MCKFMKKNIMYTIAFLLLVLFQSMSGIVTLVETDAQTLSYGDVDMNGVVEASDALSVLKCVVRLQDFDTTQQELADLDGNGKVEAPDALAILKTVVHLQAEIPFGGQQGEETDPTEEAKPTGSTYVLNLNTMKFHYPDCSAAKKISDKNRGESDLSREELILQGYSPCGICKP